MSQNDNKILWFKDEDYHNHSNWKKILNDELEVRMFRPMLIQKKPFQNEWVVYGMIFSKNGRNTEYAELHLLSISLERGQTADDVWYGTWHRVYVWEVSKNKPSEMKTYYPNLNKLVFPPFSEGIIKNNQHWFETENGFFIANSIEAEQENGWWVAQGKFEHRYTFPAKLYFRNDVKNPTSADAVWDAPFKDWFIVRLD